MSERILYPEKEQRFPPPGKLHNLARYWKKSLYQQANRRSAVLYKVISSLKKAAEFRENGYDK